MKIIDYLKETKSEMRHVSWPTQKQAINFTALVIGVSLFVSVLLGAFDSIFDFSLKQFILNDNLTQTSLDSKTTPLNVDGNNTQEVPNTKTTKDK